VLGGVGDVINTGLVSNLARPDANITGFIALNVELEEKRLELLKEVVPSLSRVAVLGNSSNPLNRINLETAHRAAKKLSVAIERFEVRSSEEVVRFARWSKRVQMRRFLHPIRCSWASAGRLWIRWR
jgi:putative tryptophan/tyrosine transport system substrate-binding protein